MSTFSSAMPSEEPTDPRLAVKPAGPPSGGAPTGADAAPPWNDLTLTITVVEHPRGFLMRIEHDGAAMTLSRVEAMELFEKLNANLGKMPVKL